MHKKYNNFLIISFILISALGVYSYFYNGASTEAANEDALSSSLDVVPTVALPTTVASAKATEDTAFLMKLASLTRIKVNTSLFEDKKFKLLVDNNIKLTPEPYGRENPFSPTGNRPVTSSATTSTLKTNNATAITSKSAILNGSLESATSNNIYFEYGIIPTFGKVTPKVITSSVGNFAANITGLTPKTTYFYRSVANINGVLTYGDTISFNTN